MMKLRPYQQEAIAAVQAYWKNEGGGNHPLVEMATGTGKSVVIAALFQELLSGNRKGLVLAHVKELVSQNLAAFSRICPEFPAGIYSAGLNRRETHQRIVFSSIQSIFRRPSLFKDFDCIGIDEAHLIPRAGGGMYRSFLDKMSALHPNIRIVGFTATPYRLDSGRLDEGIDKLFDKTVYSYSVSRGIAEGFLSPLVSKATIARIDTKDVAIRSGEFVAKDLEKAVEPVTEEAVTEILHLGEDRKSWLVFCSGVQHAMRVKEELICRGIPAGVVHSKSTHGERDRILRQFQNGEIRALTNANLLTTGFDIPRVDLVVMLRPTLSTSLYVQMVGRGTRLSAGKENCLVLDFAGNVLRHGPVDAVSFSQRKSIGIIRGAIWNKTKNMGRICPQCSSISPSNAILCKDCGHRYVWEQKYEVRHEARADAFNRILTTEPSSLKQVPVEDWKFRLYRKNPSSLPVLEVTYTSGLSTFREWLALEHTGFAAQKARNWWEKHGGVSPFPETVAEALPRCGELTRPVVIFVRQKERYWDIVSSSFNRKETENATIRKESIRYD